MIHQNVPPVRAEIDRISQIFTKAGAKIIETDALQPAEVLLDLYGEDIRARAFVTHDPVLGELMLRPDFTVPVVREHMVTGERAARYTYSGTVWRKQEIGASRKSEYPQVGFEVFGGDDAASADAEVFSLLSETLNGIPVTPVTGDISIIFAAIDSLETSERRTAALRRHVWRPNRFNRLLQRFGRVEEISGSRQAMFSAVRSGNIDKMIENAGKISGLRSISEINTRAENLMKDTNEAPVPSEKLDMVTQLLGLKCMMSEASERLLQISSSAPALVSAAKRMERRAAALEAKSVDTTKLRFDAGYGRTTLEYYDGFVFGFDAVGYDDLPQLAQGGRYDAMTRVLGDGDAVPAVGGIVRPASVLAVKRALA